MSKRLSFLYDMAETSSNFECIDLIESCYDALDEGAGDDTRYVITTANRYTYTTLIEYLERAKKFLDSMCDTLTSCFNNYVINKVTLLERYGEIVAERYKDIGEPITYKTYRYEHLFDSKFPRIYSPKEALDYMKVNTSSNAADVRVMVDDLISKFGEEVTGGVVDPQAIADSVSDIMRDELQGREIVKVLGQDQVALKIRALVGIKTMRKRIGMIRAAVNDMYEHLKTEVIDELRQVGYDASPWKIDEIRDPRLRELNSADKERFSTISVETTRLVDGFIKIYASAYRTTIEVYGDKIAEDTNLINEILVRTKLFTAVNPRVILKGKAPQKAAPKIKA